MADEVTSLDEFRGHAALQQTNARRRQLHQERSSVPDDHAFQKMSERYLSSPRVETWPDAAAMAIYLLRLFAMTEVAQEPVRRRLIAQTIEDLSKLSEDEAEA